jgi:hypothetical protein
VGDQKANEKDLRALEGATLTQTIRLALRWFHWPGHFAGGAWAVDTFCKEDMLMRGSLNATLAIVSKDVAEDVVLTLRAPELDGSTLRYSVTVLEGDDDVEGGPCSLFVDPVGMPLTPVSVAGVARRTTRRTVRRMAYRD